MLQFELSTIVDSLGCDCRGHHLLRAVQVLAVRIRVEDVTGAALVHVKVCHKLDCVCESRERHVFLSRYCRCGTHTDTKVLR